MRALVWALMPISLFNVATPIRPAAVDENMGAISSGPIGPFYLGKSFDGHFSFQAKKAGIYAFELYLTNALKSKRSLLSGTSALQTLSIGQSVKFSYHIKAAEFSMGANIVGFTVKRVNASPVSTNTLQAEVELPLRDRYLNKEVTSFPSRHIYSPSEWYYFEEGARKNGVAIYRFPDSIPLPHLEQTGNYVAFSSFTFKYSNNGTKGTFVGNAHLALESYIDDFRIGTRYADYRLFPLKITRESFSTGTEYSYYSVSLDRSYYVDRRNLAMSYQPAGEFFLSNKLYVPVNPKEKGKKYAFKVAISSSQFYETIFAQGTYQRGKDRFGSAGSSSFYISGGSGGF